jgi:methylase of polypeptide subunit release factors
VGAHRDPFCDPFSVAGIRHTIKSELSPLQRAMVELFMLGEGVDLGQAQACLDESDLQNLIECGVLLRDADRIRSRFIITAYANRLFLVSPPLWMRRWEAGEVFVYVGPDSYWMARFVTNLGPAELALDLGCGSGLLGSLVDARHVVAVELDSEVSEVARFNAVLNGLGSRLEVRLGDFYHALHDNERFDLIVANPPFLPAPSGVSMPKSGDGGVDGNDAVRSIVAGLDERLTFGGRALIYAESFGDEREPSITSRLRETIAGTELQGVMFIGAVRSLESAGNTLRQLWLEAGANEEQAFEAWNSICEDRTLSRHYRYLLDIGSCGKGKLVTQRIVGV